MHVTMYLLMYVDDLILTSSDDWLLSQFTQQPMAKFSIKDLGILSCFLGIKEIPIPNGILLSQHNYIHHLLDKTKILLAYEVHMPMSPNNMPNFLDGTSLLVSHSPDH